MRRKSTKHVRTITTAARIMLTTWKQCYLDTRARIEASGRDSRWEFDRKRLFERTDYMAGICQNLCDVAQVSAIVPQLTELCFYVTPTAGSSDLITPSPALVVLYDVPDEHFLSACETSRVVLLAFRFLEAARVTYSFPQQQRMTSLTKYIPSACETSPVVLLAFRLLVAACTTCSFPLDLSP